jgi:hypothetical protein
MGCEITKILLNPEQRVKHIEHNMRVEGVTSSSIKRCIDSYEAHIRQKLQIVQEKENLEKILGFLSKIRGRVDSGKFIEDCLSCYCGLPLSKVPEEKRAQLISDHLKIKSYIEAAGLTTYDPAEAPFNPQGELIGQPQEIFDVDNLMVLVSKFFEFTNLEASTGAGIEQRTAMTYNKVPLIITKRGEYVTRMSTGARRIILLEYDNIDSIAEEFTDFIRILKEFSPGTGICKSHGESLIGFENGSKSPVCLHGLAEYHLPHMKYNFDNYKK